MRPPAFARAHDVIRRHGELLRVLHALEPSAFTKVQQSYAGSISTIIRCVGGWWGWRLGMAVSRRNGLLLGWGVCVCVWGGGGCACRALPALSGSAAAGRQPPATRHPKMHLAPAALFTPPASPAPPHLGTFFSTTSAPPAQEVDARQRV
jgi:hypothetical protein